jgi:zinc transport system substrate-binding protein
VIGARSTLECAYRGGLIALLVCACSGEDSVDRAPTEREPDDLLVYAVNYPLAYFAGRIAGDDAEVRYPVPAGIDPADWSPTPGEVAEFQQADLILLNGGDYARWLQRASLRRGRRIDTWSGFRDRLIELRGGISHAHGPLETELVELDEQLVAASAKLRDTPILFSHPVYQYFERRYRLNGRSLHWEPGEVPEPKMWRALEASLENHPARLMLWEAEPAPETVRRLDALGVHIAVFSPCANTPANGNWLSTIRSNAATLEKMGDLLALP